MSEDLATAVGSEGGDGGALVRTRREGPVLVVTMESGATGNSLTVAMTEALAAALETACDQEDVHCVLLRSGARHFCTGGNVKDMRDGTDLMDGGVEEVAGRLWNSLHRIPRAMQALEVPVIAAVRGAAVGAGCDLALMADMRIAAEDARFAESFLRLGLVSGIGGAWFLTRAVGLARAMEMSLTSDFIEAPAALAMGLVSRVVPTGELDAAAMALAQRVAAHPPTALRQTKRMVRTAAQSGLEDTLALAASVQASLLCGEEHKAAVRRFLETQR